MTLHPGVYRNHHTPTLDRFGADVGRDIPVAVEFTRGLQPLLERYGTATGFHLVLFTLDETVFSREIAPLAGLLPERLRGRAVVVPRRARGDPPLPRAPSPRPPGSAAPRASSTTPARSAPSRPATTCRAGSTAATSPSWSPTHRLDEDEALATAHDLVAANPKVAFKL